MKTQNLHLLSNLFFYLMLFSLLMVLDTSFAYYNYDKSKDRLQNWFLENTVKVNKWEENEKLGASEILFVNLTIHEQKSYLIKNMIKEMTASLINKVPDSIENNYKFNPNLARALIINILISQRNSPERSLLVKKALNYDPDNGFVWMLEAEKLWNRGDYKKFVSMCHKAVESKIISLRSKNTTRRMLKAIEKAGLSDANVLRTLISLETSLEDENLLRQGALIYYLNVFQRISGSEASSIRKGIAREYFSRLEGIRPISSISYVVHAHLLDHLVKGAQISPYQIDDCLRDEKKLLNLQWLALCLQESILTKLIRESIDEEGNECSNENIHSAKQKLKSFLEDPEAWRQEIKESNHLAKKAPDPNDWKKFWIEFRKKMAEKQDTDIFEKIETEIEEYENLENINKKLLKNMGIMQCPKCGKMIPADANQCPICGWGGLKKWREKHKKD